MPKQKKEPPAPPRPWTDELETDLRRILTVGEECISESELRNLILSKGRGTEKYAEGGDNDDEGAGGEGEDEDKKVDIAPRIRLYDGFEPSGRMHIAQGLLKSVNVNKCTSPGTHATFCFWVADWFALMNDKMGGDLDKIIVVGKYLIEVWKAAGMDLTNVEFRWASEEITQRASVYWPLMLDVARRFNVTRIKKCCQIMGRLEGSLTAAQVLYPLMQCSDVFFLKADICQLGVDQRKVNMLAREYCDAAKKRFKPVILSHHMLYGLKEGQEKMSKSDPDSAIFMEDTAEDVGRKIRAAYCPTKAGSSSSSNNNNNEDAGKESMHLAEDDLKNPILDYVQHIVMSPPGATFSCATASAPDGQTYADYGAVKEDFLRGDISPDQLKAGLIDALNELLQPVRDHFANDDNARGLLERVREYKRGTSSGGDGATASAAPKVVRLDLAKEGVIPAGSHLVFAPLPTSGPTLQGVADVLVKLKEGGNIDGKNSPKVLMLRDWTARVEGALDADPKLIAAHDSLFLASLRALDAHLHGEEGSVMRDVTVVTQSDAILRDPSNYWISVINAGRHFSLDEVMGIGIGRGVEAMKDSEGVGKVIGRLMMVADVLAVNPGSVALDQGPAGGEEVAEGVADMDLNDTKGGKEGEDDGSPKSAEEHLIRRFYSTKLSHPDLASVLPAPRIIARAAPSSSSSRPNLALQPPRESAAHRTEHDEYFLSDDPKVHGKSKVKKAFCEPGNVDFCPPIELLAYFGGLDNDDKNNGGVTVPRSPENGGDVTYVAKSDIVKDFEGGALHPGDLKGAVSAIMVGVLTKINEAVKADGDAAKGVKALKAFEKKMAKQKKK